MATPVELEQIQSFQGMLSRTYRKRPIDMFTGFLGAPAPDIARLERENQKPRTENAALEGFCTQLSEIIDRLTAAARRKT